MPRAGAQRAPINETLHRHLRQEIPRRGKRRASDLATSSSPGFLSKPLKPIVVEVKKDEIEPEPVSKAVSSEMRVPTATAEKEPHNAVKPKPQLTLDLSSDEEVKPKDFPKSRGHRLLLKAQSQAPTVSPPTFVNIDLPSTPPLPASYEDLCDRFNVLIRAFQQKTGNWVVSVDKLGLPLDSVRRIASVVPTHIELIWGSGDDSGVLVRRILPRVFLDRTSNGELEVYELFRERLMDRVQEEHDAFLSTLDPNEQPPSRSRSLRAWHPKFQLESVELPMPITLPARQQRELSGPVLPAYKGPVEKVSITVERRAAPLGISPQHWERLGRKDEFAKGREEWKKDREFPTIRNRLVKLVPAVDAVFDQKKVKPLQQLIDPLKRKYGGDILSDLRMLEVLGPRGWIEVFKIARGQTSSTFVKLNRKEFKQVTDVIKQRSDEEVMDAKAKV